MQLWNVEEKNQSNDYVKATKQLYQNKITFDSSNTLYSKLEQLLLGVSNSMMILTPLKENKKI